MNLLETFPGWPEADVLSNLEMLLLMVIGPFAVGAVIMLLVMAPKMARDRREAAAVRTTEIEPRHG